ncbi:VOC family protein [Nocardia sp. XZ_19_385]|uniref:VOC family protein n=1 Tax=Nocardia sp. XZ_19_385 TaxID=2769488 RepID=UPI00189049FA|nr:VOC family protein [Nocardia sp. XZ_19_385]
MGCRMSELVLDCTDAEELARFWCEVLGYTVLDRDDEGGIEIGPAAGFGGLQPTIILSPGMEPRREKSRLHWDVSPTGVDQETELKRLLGLGARQVDIGQGDVSWHVLADPEGNEFCLLRSPIPA